MAETKTYDPGTDSVTMGDNLTPDEQESLKVGEELQAQQEGLLAGKYKTAEELERAYGELERKLGEQGNKDSETNDQTKVSESDEVSQEKKEASEDSQEFYLAFLHLYTDGNILCHGILVKIYSYR